MIKGEFLTADDLGPLGRLVAPGELLVLEPREIDQVRQERVWVGGKYMDADRRAEAFRRRIRRGALLGEHADDVRDAFKAWTIEAAKLSLCDRWLAKIEQMLDKGEKQAMNTPRGFAWDSIPQVTEVVQRVIKATDDEIISGDVFRTR
ncbi:hypothetical protein ACFW2V_12385 [Streptomyces sp. NPDC058947]|uniref:hypothetical protein n=1 Tax=Streptomyces sp. NPDC058947 TaxID=3346675 RepID=UPI0036C40507